MTRQTEDPLARRLRLLVDGYAHAWKRAFDTIGELAAERDELRATLRRGEPVALCLTCGQHFPVVQDHEDDHYGRDCKAEWRTGRFIPDKADDA